MRFIRPMIFIVMALAIGTGGYLLSTHPTAGNAQAESSALPTAYIETNAVSASFKLGEGLLKSLFTKEIPSKKARFWQGCRARSWKPSLLRPMLQLRWLRARSQKRKAQRRRRRRRSSRRQRGNGDVGDGGAANRSSESGG